MSGSRRETGLAAENAAVEYLENLGYDILERNYRKRYGEIDIIARLDDCIHFIEIKSRRSPSGIKPVENWGDEQRERFVLLAGEYLAGHPELSKTGKTDVSLDFIGVELGSGGDILSIEFIRDAFRPE